MYFLCVHGTRVSCIVCTAACMAPCSREQ